MLLDERQYPDDTAIRGFYERLTADLRGRPAVVSAAAGSFVPFARGGDGTEFFIEGRPDPGPQGHAWRVLESDHHRLRRHVAPAARPRPPAWRGRQRRRPEGGDDQRDAGAAPLRRPRCRRPAASSGPSVARVLDDRGHRGRREELRDRGRERAADLRAVRAAAHQADDCRGSHVRRSGSACRNGPGRRRRPRSCRTDVAGLRHGRAHRPRHDALSHDLHLCVVLWRGHAAAGRRGRVRRGLLQLQPADARDRPAHGAWRPPESTSRRWC